MAANRYFVQTRWDEPLEFDINNDEPVKHTAITYFIRGFRRFVEKTDLHDHIIYFVWGANRNIPAKGKNVVVIIFSDEHCRIPQYAKDVKIIFKPFGMFPNFSFRSHPIRLAQIEIAEFARNLALWMPHGWRWLAYKKIRNKCFLLPIGYGVPHVFNVQPFESRKYLITFQGSISESENKRKLRKFIGTPKHYCRSKLLSVLCMMKLSYGKDKIRIDVTGGFEKSLIKGNQGYVEIFEQTKICVAPRGTSRETFRLADGLRNGCIVITDQLPDHPFYRNSPIIQVQDWSELPKIVNDLMTNPSRMLEIHYASLVHWNKTLSEEAAASLFEEGFATVEKDS